MMHIKFLVIVFILFCSQVTLLGVPGDVVNNSATALKVNSTSRSNDKALNFVSQSGNNSYHENSPVAPQVDSKYINNFDIGVAKTVSNKKSSNSKKNDQEPQFKTLKVKASKSDGIDFEALANSESISDRDEYHDKTANQKLVASIKHEDDFTKFQFDYVKNLLKSAMKERPNLDESGLRVDEKGDVKGRLFNASYRAEDDFFHVTFPDTNAINEHIRNFDRSTRTSAKEILKQLKDVKFVDRNFGKKLKDEDKAKIAVFMVKTQIDNVFGVSAIGDSFVQLSTEAQDKIYNEILKNHSTVFDPSVRNLQGVAVGLKTDGQWLNEIAKISDMIMNKFSKGTGATFETNIDDSGMYTSTITDVKGITLKSVINNDGDRTSRTLQVEDVDAQGEKIKTEIHTTIDPKTEIEETFVSQGDLINEKLTPNYEKLAQEATLTYQTTVMMKTVIKTSLYYTKCKTAQAVSNLFDARIAMVVQLGLMGVVKVCDVADEIRQNRSEPGSLLEHAQDAAKTPLMKVLNTHMGEITGIADNGLLTRMSNDPTRVFAKGSYSSRIFNGKIFIGKGEAFDEDEEYMALLSDCKSLVKDRLMKSFPKDRLIETSEVDRIVQQVVITMIDSVLDIVI